MYLTNNNIKIVQWNCNGFVSKMALIKQFLLDEKPEFLMLNEIKCENVKNDLRIYFNNYVIEEKCRNKHGGGVAILIRNDIKYEKILNFDYLNQELVVIKTTINNINTYLCTWYNRPQNILNS